jgi:DNA-binding beta-propeller fold protein YncE
MKTQISRHSRNRDKRYSGVYQQQGRMLTDADWNELGDIIKERLDDALRDVIGSGSPRHRGMVHVTPGPGGDTIELCWGHVYVDGVPAEVRPAEPGDPAFDYTKQADFPQPPPLPGPGIDYTLYLDVWERAVTSLQDGDLRDPGLHGADTCTRTQTMAQVKWCPAGVDPEKTAVNPPMGNAALTLTLRQGSTEPDPCDPCADEVALQDRVGNYLFRVEVHDVELDSEGKPTRLVLKWSSENGAEEHAVAGEPPGFKTNRRVFEFFHGESQAYASEKHLGVHLTGGTWKPARGVLSTGYPGTPPAGFHLVRRWDGYCTLARAGDGTWSLAKGPGGAVLGSHRGLLLSTTSASDAPGHVALSSSLEVKLDALVLDLELEGKVFVAGDYWYAVVREAVHRSGDTVLSASGPVGVIHHYMTLATVSGGVITAYSGDQCQRGPFPPLTDLRAGDICYDSTRCDMPEVDTVQEAIDHLCQERDLRHHNKHLHGWGIVCGLQVQCGPDTPSLCEEGESTRRQVSVRKGYALDCEGNDIVLEDTEHIDVMSLIEEHEGEGQEPLLEDGKGTVCLTMKTGPQGKPSFDVSAYEPDSSLRALLKGTIWVDFFDKCINNLIEAFREEFTQKPDDKSLVGPVQKRITTLMNLAVHFYSHDGQYVFLSPAEHEILRDFYKRLRCLLQSKTFCGMYAGDEFPDYPFPDTTLSTIFGKGFHSRMRLHPDGARAYTCSGTDTTIHVYDLVAQEMIAELEMPAGEGAEVKDIAFSPDGKRLYAVAVLGDMDTIFGVADIAGSEHIWRRVTVLCDTKLATLVAAPGTENLLYAIGPGRGLFFLDPDALLDQDKPRPQPRFQFNATGQMTIDETTGWVYAASSRKDAITSYDSIAAMDARNAPAGDNHPPGSMTALMIGNEAVSGDDDMVWARVDQYSHVSGRVYIVVKSSQGKRIHGYHVVGREVVPDAKIDIPVQDTMGRLAHHRGAGKVLATMASGFRVQIIDIASHQTTILRHPVQIMPMAIATAAEQKHTYVLNFASNTITVIPDDELAVADSQFLSALQTYRYQVIAA